jgi:hypothetical protein
LRGLLALTSSAIAASSSLKSMTLQLSDMPAGFSRDYSHAVSKAEVIKQQNYVMPGFFAAWETQFTREEGFRTAIAVSSVSRYRSTAQAHASMLDTWKGAAKQGKVKRISVGAPLGHEAHAFSYTAKGATVYIVVWRQANLKARLLLGGLPSLGATAQQTTRLAIRQQARMRAGVTPTGSGAAERKQLPILLGESPMRGGIDQKIILRKGIGEQVTRLKAGTYKLYVRVKLSDHNFHLIGPGINRSTRRGFVGTQTWIVRFRPGVYTYQSDHKLPRMRETFRVY